MSEIQAKALYYREPYSSKPGVKPYIPRDEDTTVLEAGDVIATDEMVDLTDRLYPDGSITWEVPVGEWTILRLGARNNGAVTRPSPLPGVGFECDKADTNALKAHLDIFIESLLARLGKRDPKATGGLKNLHMDSWEMGTQNWTPRLREEFLRRRGYDPQPYYPVYAGYVVGGRQRSERFLWDLRQTMQELMLEFHAGYVREYAHRHGMELSIEPYDMNPTQDLELGGHGRHPNVRILESGGLQHLVQLRGRQLFGQHQGRTDGPLRGLHGPPRRLAATPRVDEKPDRLGTGCRH